MNCNVINTNYKLTFSQDFNGEVEAKIRTNTNGIYGTSTNVQEIGFLISDLLIDIQDIGNLRGTFITYSGYYGYICDVGELFFEVYYDPIERTFIIRFLDVKWNVGVHPYSHLLEHKKVSQIVTETIHTYLSKNCINIQNKKCI